MVVLDGHQHCLRHAPCTDKVWPHEPKDCPPCCAALTMLLEKQNLTGLKSELASIRHHWKNLVALCNCHGRPASWADPDLSLLLGSGRPAHHSLSLLLQSLLRDTPQLKNGIFKFQSLAWQTTVQCTPPVLRPLLLLCSHLVPSHCVQSARLKDPVRFLYQHSNAHQTFCLPPSPCYPPMHLRMIHPRQLLKTVSNGFHA